MASIHLKSADPLAAPSIRPNFLSAQVDRDSLVGGMRVARRIVQRPALQRYIERELSPGRTWTATSNGWISRAATARPSTTRSAPAAWARTPAR
ncbi:GMC oxidoreductase [Achromobacter insuavis]